MLVDPASLHAQDFFEIQQKRHRTLPPLNRRYSRGATPVYKACKTTHINKCHSNVSASRDLNELLKLIFKHQTMLEFFFWHLNYSKYGIAQK